jgi:hypothetical protein
VFLPIYCLSPNQYWHTFISFHVRFSSLSRPFSSRFWENENKKIGLILSATLGFYKILLFPLSIGVGVVSLYKVREIWWARSVRPNKNFYIFFFLAWAEKKFSFFSTA